MLPAHLPKGHPKPFSLSIAPTVYTVPKGLIYETAVGYQCVRATSIT